MKLKLLCGFMAAFPFFAIAQYSQQWSSAEILHELHKLDNVGKVLYLAAHPDDENTRLIAHLANRERVDVAYLALTRGDGGQNLIGTEIGTELGLIRTQELLAARRTDGGQQFFSRALDFGYSKGPEETMAIWGRDEILSDVVWVIRRYQPDVIINRFSHDDPRGHGHHTASAMLSVEAFDLAADPTAFPEQLEYVDVWQPRQLWHNVSTWWDKTLPERAEKDPSIISFEVSDYEPLLGKSIGEIASLSRSKHSSQGFGTTLQRGSNTEYLQLIKNKGDSDSLFTAGQKDWSQLEGGREVTEGIKAVIDSFDSHAPEASVLDLIDLARVIKSMPDNRFRQEKLQHVEELIVQCSGLWVEATTGYDQVLRGMEVPIELSFLNRSAVPVEVSGFEINGTDTTFSHDLIYNRTHLVPIKMEVAQDHPYTEQYWLREPPLEGRFIVKDQMLRGLPESSWPFTAGVEVKISDYAMTVHVPLIKKWADRAKGEQIRLVKVVPPLSVNPSEKIIISPHNKAVEMQVKLRANAEMQMGVLRPELPEGWSSEPPAEHFELRRKGEEQVLSFQLIPGKKSTNGTIRWVAETPDGEYSQSEKEIDYDHIPVQPVLNESTVEAISFSLETSGSRIGYLEGSGDDVPTALRRMGYDVEILTTEDIGSRDLSVFDAIITGIRAYNVLDGLVGVNHRLKDYVHAGGNLIVQYNVTYGLLVEDIGPHPFQISRLRVTDETAEPTFLEKKHPILNYPNKLGKSDFDGWVQERGLYFADEWDEAFTPLISWNDSGEDPVKGGLIVSQHGKGTFAYTGISFFRQLPAGVPGAYRLMANLIAGGRDGR